MPAMRAATVRPSDVPSAARAPRERLARLWPLPALMAWSAAWIAAALVSRAGVGDAVAWIVGLLMGVVLAIPAATRMRAVITVAGFPLSWLAATGAGSLPPWAWLAALAVLAALYPARTWHDAPLFPTPADALDALARSVPLPPGARILDAGCGLGHGLRALRRAYPEARLEGVEWSRPLAALARLACGWAVVRRGDMWARSWHEFDLVYLFQRPESMDQALRKARAELRAGAWLASLEFEAAGWPAQACLRCPDGRSLWLYRSPLAQAPDRQADKGLSVA